MHIKTIATNTTESLLALIEQSNKEKVRKKILHFQLSKLALSPTKDEVLFAIRQVFTDTECSVFFFPDNDIAIAWQGSPRASLDALLNRLYESFILTEQDLHTYYDSLDNAQEALSFYEQKADDGIQSAGKQMEKPFNFAYTAKERQDFREAGYARDYRDRPDILIVEDQVFSANLLSSMMAHKYKTYKAANAEQAWKLYFEHAPDIAFVDIELPDISGLELVEEIAKIDPQAFMVMVTSHHSQKEVERARASGVKGFIVKPYSKQKILDAIQKYAMEKKSASAGNTKLRKSDGAH